MHASSTESISPWLMALQQRLGPWYTAQEISIEPREVADMLWVGEVAIKIRRSTQVEEMQSAITAMPR
ncbi:hypothetical protein M433DRAFT_216114 [Acidomyces richmondensis BFW]|nr:hypothetical protein M433DRAFT_216114 [Acidomyces richmondensis BFW]